MSPASILASLRKNPSAVFIGLFLVWFIAAFLVFPNVNFIVLSFFGDDASEGMIRKLIDSPIAMRGLRNSFVLAIALSITTNIVGIFIVLVSEYFDIKGAKLLKVGYMTTFVYGGIILVSGYLMLYGQTGVVTRLLTNLFPEMNQQWFQGFWPVLFVMTVATTTSHMMFLTNAVRSIDNFTIEAAKNMGAKPFYIIRRVVLPIVMPTIYAVTILQFLTGLGAFSAPLLLGGRDFQTIAPLVLQLNSIPGSRGLAIILSFILGLATVVLLTVFARLQRGGTYFSISKTKAEYVKQKIDNKVLNALVHVMAYLLFAIYVLPVIVIVLFSFTNATAIFEVRFSLSDLTLQNYINVFSDRDRIEPFFNSINFSALASLGVVVVVLMGVHLQHRFDNPFTKIVEYSFLIPWMIPSLIIALGLLSAYDTPRLIMGNRVLIGTVAILVMAYIVSKIPMTSRLLKASYQSIDSEYELAARALGARGFYIFRRITLPLVFPTVIALAVLSFNSLLADYNLTVFLSHPLREPLGLMIRRFTNIRADGDTQALIYVYSTVLMAIAGVTVYLVYGVLLKVRDGRGKARGDRSALVQARLSRVP